MGTQELRKETVSTRKERRGATWNPPPFGWTKINVDTSYSLSSSRGAVTAVCRDNNGKLLTASMSNQICSSPLAVEVIAVREAVILARNL
ncbi:hypothetical protein PIB30_073391 [Stylosanthes scabra]|uniref:RNase H type-1 domain-containing protein n=1 Tax=Stylosanthes scabra TaxID=79078 RepID=A0ABU6ZMZ5_9FABA|nr:hypothetical protein [Stylosanthes scabra]